MNLAAVIEGELLSHDDIRQAMQRPEFSARLKDRILDGFSEFLSTRLGSLNPMIAMFLDGPMMEKIKGWTSELDWHRAGPAGDGHAWRTWEEQPDFAASSATRSRTCPWNAWKSWSRPIMAREFVDEVVGAVLGAFIVDPGPALRSG